MKNPQNLGLGELGQRVPAMSAPVPDSRLRPYQGAQAANGHSGPSFASPSFESDEESRTKQPAEVYPPQAAHPYQPTGPAPVSPEAPKSGFHRALGAIRSTLPLVQKLLPLIDGNFATAVGALMAPHSHPTPPSQPQVVQVDLEPMERGLAEVRNSHRELRGQVQEQVTTLKRVEDHLERVREATDRNTLEQQELAQDLRSVGGRLTTFAIVGLLLLAGSIGLNIYLILQLQHILR